MGTTLATMATMTTYGTWLRGDARGWVDNGIIFPANPTLQNADAQRMKYPPFLFDQDVLLETAEIMVAALVNNLGVDVLAMTVQIWHSHFVIGSTLLDIGRIIKCAKAAPRWKHGLGRPIWADGYDKRWCFDRGSVVSRVEYVERHNLQNDWAARPSPLIHNYIWPWTYLSGVRTHLNPRTSTSRAKWISSIWARGRPRQTAGRGRRR